MTDKELIEMAAKAAGIQGCVIEDADEFNFWLTKPDSIVGQTWAPLTDDGERYRLAKQLDIRIHFGAGYITYVVSGISRVLRWPEDVADDAYAVVSAAAEIGSSMKGQK